MQLSRTFTELLMIGAVMGYFCPCTLAIPSRSLAIPQIPLNDINDTGSSNSTDVKQTCFSGRCRYPARCCPGFRCLSLAVLPFMTGICVRDFGGSDYDYEEEKSIGEEDDSLTKEIS